MGYVVRVWIQQSPLLLLIDRLIHFKAIILVLKVEIVVIGILKLGRAKKWHLTFSHLAALLIQLWRLVIFDLVTTLLLLSLYLHELLPVCWTHRFCEVFRSVVIRHEWRVIFISLTVRGLVHLIGLQKCILTSWFICDVWAHVKLRLRFIRLNFFIWGRQWASISFRWHNLRNSSLINYQCVCASCWSNASSARERNIMIVILIFTLRFMCTCGTDTDSTLSKVLALSKRCSYNFSSIQIPST